MGPFRSNSATHFPDANSTSASEPSKKSASNTPAPHNHLTPSHNPPIRILLAEDDPDIRHLTRSILVAQGYTVFSCADGRDALEIVRAAPPFDLLITDIQMPHLTGLDLAAHLCVTYPRTPVIIMSGNPPSQSTLVNIAHRGWHFFAKPVPITQLLDAIEHIVAAYPASKTSHPSQPISAPGTLHAKHA